MEPIPVFDGHNDTLLSLARPARGAERSFFERSQHGHIDLPRAREGGLAGGLFACYVPSEEEAVPVLPATGGPYDLPLPEPPAMGPARSFVDKLAATLLRLERASGGAVGLCRTVGEIRDCLASGRLAAVLHIEGAEAVDPELDALEVFYAAGLRSLGIVWSRPNAFGHGVPFRFPSTGDTGPGLTDAGKELVRACNELGVMIDLSHLNEAGFWDVADISEAPLVASHSNAHALCPSARNLTDRQLDAIRERQGLVGLNFAVAMLRPDGRRDADTPLEILVRHVDHLVERLGLEGVAFGSDFDGTTVPRVVGDASGLPRLLEALRSHGYDEGALRRLAFENWLSVLERSWKGGDPGRG